MGTDRARTRRFRAVWQSMLGIAGASPCSNPSVTIRPGPGRRLRTLHVDETKQGSGHFIDPLHGAFSRTVGGVLHPLDAAISPQRHGSEMTSNGQEHFLNMAISPLAKQRLLVTSIAACVMTLSGCATQADKESRPSVAVLRSAEQGNPVAEYSVGRFYFERASSAVDREKGLAKILDAANRNLAMAQDFMGVIYLQGRGVPQSTTMAMAWLNRAADYGAPAAQLQLGNMYAAGEVVPTDKGRAYFWLSVLARPEPSSVTIYNIDRLRSIASRRAKLIAASLDSAERDQIDRRVASWKPERGVPYSTVVSLDNADY